MEPKLGRWHSINLINHTQLILINHMIMSVIYYVTWGNINYTLQYFEFFYSLVNSLYCLVNPLTLPKEIRSSTTAAQGRTITVDRSVPNVRIMKKTKQNTYTGKDQVREVPSNAHRLTLKQ